MSSFRRFAHRAVLSSSVLVLSGACSIFPTAATTSLYTLNLPAPIATQRCSANFSIRELKLAGYLDRAELVTDRSDAQVQASALHLWAGPLKDELRRTLGLAVSQRWTDSRLTSYPWRYGETPTVALDISIDQLEPVGGRLQIQARWQLLAMATSGRENAKLIRHANFQKSLSLPSVDANGVVMAMNQTLSMLTDEIARTATEPEFKLALCGS